MVSQQGHAIVAYQEQLVNLQATNTHLLQTQQMCILVEVTSDTQVKESYAHFTQLARKVFEYVTGSSMYLINYSSSADEYAVTLKAQSGYNATLKAIFLDGFTPLLKWSLPRNSEDITLIITSPANQIILCFPWLRDHNFLVQERMSHWSYHCQINCLKWVLHMPCYTTMVESPNTTRTMIIPREYHCLKEVFSKEHAT